MPCPSLLTPLASTDGRMLICDFRIGATDNVAWRGTLERKHRPGVMDGLAQLNCEEAVLCRHCLIVTDGMR